MNYTKKIVILLLLWSSLIPSHVFAIQQTASVTGNNYAFNMVNSSETSNLGFTGKGVKIAVLDTGYSPNELGKVPSGGANCANTVSDPDLYGLTVCRSAVAGEDWSFLGDVGMNGVGNNVLFHGTGISGIINSYPDPTQNYMGGIAPDSEIYPVRVFDNDRLPDRDAIMRGVDWAITRNMDIIQLSISLESGPIKNFWNEWTNDLGTRVYSYALGGNATLEELLNAAYDAGITIICGAGNVDSDSTIDQNTVTKPATFESVIAVSAIDIQNHRGEFALGDISATGPKVELSAPGVRVATLRVKIPGDFSNETLTPNDGTSFAAPFVSAVAAIVRQEYPRKGEETGREYNDRIRRILKETATKYSDPNLTETENRYLYGNGIVSAKLYEPLQTIDEYVKFENAVDLYPYPSVAYDAVGELASGISVKAIQKWSSWYLIQNDRGSFWVNGEQDVVESVDLDLYLPHPAYLFPIPNKDYEPTSAIPGKQTVKAIEKWKNWYLIEVNNGEYWLDLQDQTDTIFTAKEIEYRQKFDFQWKDVAFYDQPDATGESVSKIFRTPEESRLYSISATGYNKDYSKFEWYKMFIPGLGVKWYKSNFWDVTEAYKNNDLFENVYGRFIKLSNPEPKTLIDNVNHVLYSTLMNAGDFAYYRFDQPVTVNKAFLQLEENSYGENNHIKFEFFNENQERIGEPYMPSALDIADDYFRLKAEYPNVHFVKISNVGNHELKVKEVSLFGDYEKTGVIAEYKQSVNLKGGYRDFYEAPDLNSTMETSFFNYNDDIMVTSTHALGYNADNSRFEWYQINVPGLGMKWYKPSIADVLEVYKNNDLFENVYGRFVSFSSPDFKNLMDNTNHIVFSTPMNVGSFAYYRFDQPVTVDKAFLQLEQPTFEKNIKVKFEFFDSNQQVIGASYTTNDEDDFKEYFAFNQTYENVSFVKITNMELLSINVREIALFGAFDQTGIEVDYEQTINLRGGERIFYELPDVNSERETNFFNYNDDVFVTSTRALGYNPDTSKFEWYYINVPGLGMKWYKVPAYEVSEVYKNNDLFEQVAGSFAPGSILNASSLIDNLNYIGWAVNMRPGEYANYQFEQPVTINKVFLQLEQPTFEKNTKVKFEFYDTNGSLVGSYITTDEDNYQELFSLPQSYGSIKSVKITNLETQSINIREIALFGGID